MQSKVRLVGLALGAVLGTVLILGSAGAARAGDRCAKHIDHERQELNRAIARHGYWSRQAEHDRQEIARLREECRYR
jgi:hypothetical protein